MVMNAGEFFALGPQQPLEWAVQMSDESHCYQRNMLHVTFPSPKQKAMCI